MKCTITLTFTTSAPMTDEQRDTLVGALLAQLEMLSDGDVGDLVDVNEPAAHVVEEA